MSSYYTKKIQQVDLAVLATKKVFVKFEVMAFYGMGHDLLAKMIKHYGFPIAKKVGSKTFFHRDQIDDWFNTQNII